VEHHINRPGQEAQQPPRGGEGNSSGGEVRLPRDLAIRARTDVDPYYQKMQDKRSRSEKGAELEEREAKVARREAEVAQREAEVAQQAEDLKLKQKAFVSYIREINQQREGFRKQNDNSSQFPDYGKKASEGLLDSSLVEQRSEQIPDLEQHDWKDAELNKKQQKIDILLDKAFTKVNEVKEAIEPDIIKRVPELISNLKSELTQRLPDNFERQYLPGIRVGTYKGDVKIKLVIEPMSVLRYEMQKK